MAKPALDLSKLTAEEKLETIDDLVRFCFRHLHHSG